MTSSRYSHDYGSFYSGTVQECRQQAGGERRKTREANYNIRPTKVKGGGKCSMSGVTITEYEGAEWQWQVSHEGHRA
jgi:hypothetical protein